MGNTSQQAWNTLKIQHKHSFTSRDSASFIGQHVPKTNRYDKREMKMTWSILFVFLCYIFCAAPISTLVFLNQKASYYWIISTGLYLTLFMLNFFVYSLQNEQYKKAFADYLRMLKFLIVNGSLDGYRTRQHQESIRLSTTQRHLHNEGFC